MQPQTDTQRVTTAELAIELKRAPETLKRWRRLRIGPPYMIIQGRVLYDRKVVEAWLESKAIPAVHA